jgi:hypothetical protein
MPFDCQRCIVFTTKLGVLDTGCNQTQKNTVPRSRRRLSEVVSTRKILRLPAKSKRTSEGSSPRTSIYFGVPMIKKPSPRRTVSFWLWCLGHLRELEVSDSQMAVAACLGRRRADTVQRWGPLMMVFSRNGVVRYPVPR